MDPSAHRRILIVDDDALFLESLRAMLTGAGYQVTTSTSSTDPNLPKWFSEADLVLLDLNLPERNGFELLNAIRETPETADKPVLMLTAHDPMKYRLKGLALGADDYVIKPPNRDELLLRIAGLLRRAGTTSSLDSDPSRIVVDNPGGGRAFLHARDVTHIQAARNYCHVFTHDDSWLASASIGDLEDQLGDKFVRTHRSFLVNPTKVRAARWLSSSSYVLDMDTAEETLVPVSRGYRNAVRDALGIAGEAGASAG